MGRGARTPAAEAVPGEAGTLTRHRYSSSPTRDALLAAKVGVLAATLILGLAAGLNPKLALVGIAGVALVAVVVADMTAGLIVFGVAQTLESLPELSGGTEGGASPAQLIGVFLFLGWITAVILGRADDRPSRDLLVTNPTLVWLLGLFLGWVLFSTLWAEDTGRSQVAFVYFAFVAILFPIVPAAIRTVRHVVLLYAALVCAALAAGLFAAQKGHDGRLFGSGFNPNVLGLYLVVGCVLAGTLACNRSLHVSARILAGIAAALCPVFQILSGSRGALVGIVAVLVVAPLAAGRGRRLTMVAVIVTIGAATAAGAAAFAPEAAVQRLTHWESTGSGRTDLWTIAMRMVDDKPVTGVGAGNFQVASIHYLLEPGALERSEYIADKPKETHNIYLQVLSELGVVGLSLFLAIIAYCLTCVVRAIRLAKLRGDPQLEILSRGLFVALVGLLTAMFFSSQVYSKELYLLLALTLALLGIARRAPAAPGR